MTETKRDYYCAAPFISRSYAANGVVRACCDWPSKINDPEKQLEDLRSQFLNNKPHPTCNTCYNTEDAGVKSMREDFNDEYGRPSSPVLKHIDFNLGNLCNFKCRICSSHSSSKWIADEILLGESPSPVYRRTAEDLKQLDLTNVDTIKLKGGETLLEQEAIKNIMRMLIEQKGTLSDIKIRLNTNGSVLLDPEVENYFNMCKRVYFTVSVDGYGKANDYQRTGCVWEELENNISHFHSTLSDNFELSVWPVWSILNINTVTQFFDWMLEKYPRYFIFGQVLLYPRHFDIRNLNDAAKKILIDRIGSYEYFGDNFGVDENKKMILNELNHAREISIDEVKTNIDRLDNIRNERFSEANPEMYQLLFGTS